MEKQKQLKLGRLPGIKKPRFYTKFKNLSEVGNVVGGLPKRRIVPNGCIDLGSLIFKEYYMEESNEAGSHNLQNPMHRGLIRAMLLEREILNGKLTPASGMGFLIESASILNVCRWDATYIDVIIPNVYTLEKGLWKIQKVEVVGAFCSGEKRVYDHENEAWLRYLNSKRTNQDKLNYLNDFLKAEK